MSVQTTLFSSPAPPAPQATPRDDVDVTKLVLENISLGQLVADAQRRLDMRAARIAMLESELKRARVYCRWDTPRRVVRLRVMRVRAVA